MIKKILMLLLAILLLSGCSYMEDVEWIDGEKYHENELEEMISDQLEVLNPEYDDIEVDIYQDTED